MDMDAGETTLTLVEGLKRKLMDATQDASNQQSEHNIAKILKRLSLLPMSIEILKVTQIGKDVNSLRKWGGGKVSSRAKALVKKWKQLIPEAEDAQQRHAAVSPDLRSRLDTDMPTAEPSGFRMEGYDTGIGPREGHGSRIEPREGHGSRIEPSEGCGSRIESNEGYGSREGHRSRKEPREGRGLRMESREEHGSRMEKREADRSMNQRLPAASQNSASFSDAVLGWDGPAVGNGRLTGDGSSKSREGKCRTSRIGAPVICIDSGDSEDSVVEVTRSTAPTKEQKKRKKDKKRRKSGDRHETNLEEHNVTGDCKELHPLSRDSRSRREPEQDDVMVVGQNYAASVVASEVRRERSPALQSGVGMKRKAAEPQQEVGIAQTKRSRTQVYSGKRAQTGPQAVTSLFDLCMKILIDNIDVIEEVGPGVPYHVLEPLLLRCSATQLMKLEEFNPHLVEDTEDLWRKHVNKDFKLTKLSFGVSWRELYQEKLAEKEEKLRNLTARIKANNHAREEPIRKVKIADAVRKPGRRSGFRGGGGGGFSRPMERPHPGTQLMKRTLKMAKERNHIMTFKSTK